MDVRGLVVGAGNVAQGYRATEAALRQAEEERLNLQQLRMAQAEREREEQFRRTMPRSELGDTAPLPGAPLPSQPQLRLPPAARLQEPRTGTPPAAPAAGVAVPGMDRAFAAAAPVAEAGAVQAAGALRPVTAADRIAADRQALLTAPAAVLDVVQYPMAALMNLGASRAEDIINVGGRLINAITGEEVAPTSVTLPRQSLTPFTDRWVRSGEAGTGGLRGAPTPASTTPATPAATPAVPTATDALVRAMTQVESSGRPGAVSPKGAVGLMQVRPSTAMNPGYGLPNIFDFLRYEGTRNEATATVLLKDPRNGAAYGRAYMDAMLREFGGNLDHALAAYNMGPGAAKKWVAEGADPAKLNRETREYIPKVRAELGLAAPTTAAAPPAAAAAPPAAAAGAPAAAAPGPLGAAAQSVSGVRQEVSDENLLQYYAADPGKLTADQRYLDEDYNTQRDIAVDDYNAQKSNLDASYQSVRRQLVSEYNTRFNAGQARQAQEVVGRIQQLDEQYRSGVAQLGTTTRTALATLDSKYKLGRLALATFSAASQLEYQNNPTAAARMMSYLFGQPIQYRLAGGQFDMLIPDTDGQLQVRGTFTREQILDALKAAGIAAYRDARATMMEKVRLEQLKGDVEVSKQNAQMIRELAVEAMKGRARLAEITLQGQQYKVQGDGNGGVVIYRQDGTQVGIIDPRVNQTVEGPGGQKIPAAPTIHWTAPR